MLETPRLILRGHRRDDLEDCAAMWGDEAVTRHITGKPQTREEVWARLLRYVGHWSVMGFGFWLAHERTTGRFVGEVGFANFERDLTPSFGDSPEHGWVLVSDAHGRGLATEAVQASLAWGMAHFPARRTVCLIDPANQASRRVAEKCGYREWASSIYKGEPVTMWERQGPA